MKPATVRSLICVVICLTAPPAAASAVPFVLEATIALPDTEGRIDHMDIDLTRKRLFVAKVGNGRIVAMSETCGDADDVFFDTKRRRFYVSCGAGAINIIAWTGHDLHGIGRVSTSWGARTSLFVPELDRLFVAARDGLFGTDASIFVFRPAP